MAERAEIERAEGLHPVGRGLDHVARGVDLVVQHSQHALPARFGRAGDPQRVDQVHAGIGAERARRPLRADQHHRLTDGEGQVEEKAGLLQGRGAVRDHETHDGRIVARGAVDQRPQFEPLLRDRSQCCRPGERSPLSGRRRVGSPETVRSAPRRSASARNRDSRAHRGSTRRARRSCHRCRSQRCGEVLPCCVSCAQLGSVVSPRSAYSRNETAPYVLTKYGTR